MPQDYRDLPAITERSFDVTFYNAVRSGRSSVKVFEGRTTRLSRLHLRAWVNGIGSGISEGSPEEYWPGRNLRTSFHAISAVLRDVDGEVTLIRESDDPRYRWLIEVKFDSEIDLLGMRL